MEQTTEPNSATVVPLSLKSCLDCKHCDRISGLDKKCRRTPFHGVSKIPWMDTFPLCREERTENGTCGTEGRYHEAHKSFYEEHRRHRPILPLPALPPPNNVPQTSKPIDWRYPKPYEPTSWNYPDIGISWTEMIISGITITAIVVSIFWCIVYYSRPPS